MFRAICLWVSIVAVGLPPRGASAARVFYTGNEIYQWCTSVGMQSACLSYVMAIADAMADGNKVAGFSACVPLHVTGQQVVDVVVQSFQHNPMDRHHGAASLIAEALAGAFPCR
jgi:hypothetical protein